ncbi:hypothetical protein [Salmonirosea aquatica]|uniref:Lipocalin-like domain-containing protein n=1 Tax=Salmonirosea aquatica TaxID=2654236 RepID=A0A7C9BF83_9BACT|nr:hypothetical protein [Cytophagaceae bacterium SJW1-29]
MKKLQFLATLIFLTCLLGCADKELRPYERSLVGTWRLFEVGGSTGYQWYVLPIPAIPLQSLTIMRNGKLSGQGDALSNFNRPRYRIISEGDQVKLELYGKDTDGFKSTLRIEGDTMHIAPPCFEGCHYGFVKIR